jgi:hypothetical protein
MCTNASILTIEETQMKVHSLRINNQIPTKQKQQLMAIKQSDNKIFFYFNQKHYKPKYGLAVGVPTSAILAEIRIYPKSEAHLHQQYRS